MRIHANEALVLIRVNARSFAASLRRAAGKLHGENELGETGMATRSLGGTCRNRRKQRPRQWRLGLHV